MTEPEEPRAYSRSGRALVAAAGVLLAVSLFVPWYSVDGFGASGHLSGAALSAAAPELGLFPALGLGAIAAGALASRLGRGSSVRGDALASVAIGVVGLAVAVEVVARLNGTLAADYGTSFWGAVDLGWYLAALGSLLLVAVGLLRWRTGPPGSVPAPSS